MSDIELVIKLNEVYYEGCVKHRILDTSITHIVDAIKNGTVLQPHGDLIDRDRLRPYQFDRNYIHVDDLDNARPILKAYKVEPYENEE